jgi:hypothetical protein
MNPFAAILPLKSIVYIQKTRGCQKRVASDAPWWQNFTFDYQATICAADVEARKRRTLLGVPLEIPGPHNVQHP